MGRLEGKVALVTGGASGLGKADCERFVAEGAFVFVTDIDGEKAQTLAATMGERAVGLKHDVGSDDDWKTVYAEVERRFGRLDILVNNAGIVVVADPEETSLDQYERVMRIMATSVFLGCKHGLPLLAKSKAASIINMSSIASHVGYPPFFAYSAAKGAVRSMSKSIAVHCQDKGYPVRVNTIHPSSIETPMVQSAEGRAGQENAVADGVLPPGAVGAPSDVANLVLFLASDEARFLTGGEYIVDNGMTIRP
ncbi:SDR family oxidoreductase [Sphingomonas sp.]